MPVTLTDVDEFTDVSGPSGSDIRNALSVRSALQTVANRTRYLFNRLATVNPAENGFRLTGTTGNPLVDTATPSTLYLTPYLSNRIAIYDGSAWVIRTSAEVSLALSSLTTDTNYDVFARWNGSAIALVLTAWTNGTTRATALTRQDGAWVKNGTLTDRYVGTIRTVSTTQTADTSAKRFIWNASNRLPRELVVTDATDNWTYQPGADGTWRQARAQTGNKVEVVIGLAEALLEVEVQCPVKTSQESDAGVGIGLNSTTVNSAQTFGTRIVNHALAVAKYRAHPSIGYTAVNWLETGSNNALTYTFGFNGSGFTGFLPGLVGTIEG